MGMQLIFESHMSRNTGYQKKTAKNGAFSRRFHWFVQYFFSYAMNIMHAWGVVDLRIYLAQQIMVTQYQPWAMTFVLTWHNLIPLISHCLTVLSKCLSRQNNGILYLLFKCLLKKNTILYDRNKVIGIWMGWEVECCPICGIFARV